ncbi:MAG: DUF4870 domain-containing protein [Candidatus Diapherotrites archaeon]
MSNSEDNSKTVAILAYFLIGIIWYFADEKVKKSEFAKGHVKQALNLLIIEIVVMTALGLIPILGWVMMPLASLAFIILWIIGLIAALNNQTKELPVIGQFASKYLQF